MAVNVGGKTGYLVFHWFERVISRFISTVFLCSYKYNKNSVLHEPDKKNRSNHGDGIHLRHVT